VYTTCPECGTVFRVTVAVLRAARGQVRCGVCAATFDALLYLSDNVEAEEQPPGSVADQAPDAADTADTATHAALRDGNGTDDVEAAGAHADVDADVDVDDEGDGDGSGREAARDSSTSRGRDDALADVEIDVGAFDAPAEPELDPADADAILTRAAHEPAPREPAPREPASADTEFDLDLEFDDLPPPDEDAALAAHAAAARADAAHADAADALHDDVPLEVAAELLVANADSLPPPEFPPFDEASPAAPVVTPFERRAGRHTPSADEDRALAEIAAALARGARSTNGAAAAGDDSLEIEILDPASTENLLAGENGGLEEIPDSALEFDLPAEQWNEVFVTDPGTPTIPPLDPGLAAAREAALARPAPRGAARTDDPDELAVEIEATDLDAVDATDRNDRDDAREHELDEADLDDGDLDEADAAERERARPAASEDPLAQTDTFPPLHVTPEEEAAAGLAHTPAARRHGSIASAGHTATHAGSTRLPGATNAPVPTPDFDALVAAAAAEVAARATPAPEPEPIAATSPAPADAPDWIQFDAQRFHDLARGGGERAWWATTLLALGIAVLALGLGAQLVHYWRDTLAQHPVAGPPLRELYARLGLPLEPEWNLAGYELKQWGAATDAEPGTLRVRASVVNRAPRAQPHPLLRVTLVDRFGARLARREFTPAEYLPGRAPPTQLLASGARVDADLLLADPGSDAVGFELDVCLPRHGRVVCGTDLRHGGG
jgi:predicted Zn finger-like uncharacterized protein